MEEWTKEHVKEWLTYHVKVPQKIVSCLYEQELSGSCLVCYEKQDLFDLGVPPAPAIQILRQVNRIMSQKDMIQVHGPKHHSTVTQKARDSPEPVSLEGRKMDDEPDERASSPSCLSLKSDRSMPEPVNFKCQETDLQQEWYGL